MNKRKQKRSNFRAEKIQQDRLARAAKKNIDTEDLLQSKAATNQLGPKQAGQIIAQYGTNLDLEDEQGKIHHCLTRRNLPRLVCGDHVVWQATGDALGIVVEHVERTTLLARPDYNTQLKPVAANIDQILIVAAPKPSFDEDLINRYLIAAHLTEITPVIVMNKIDLLTDSQLEQVKQRLVVYNNIGYQTLFASTKVHHGLDELFTQLDGHTSIFVGQSGVGKSSLIKQYIPDEDIRVGEISKATGLGKHTTTVTVLYRSQQHKQNTTSIIDSPGVREFGLGHVTFQRIAFGFKEFDEYVGRCKFNDCTHHNEPGCAVHEAVNNSHISLERYNSYKRIVKSLSRP